jgi:hypothetical protein
MDWGYFKQRKIEEKGKPDYFSFKNWEVDFMVDIIRFNHPGACTVEILKQIAEELNELKTPIKSDELYSKLVNHLNARS